MTLHFADGTSIVCEMPTCGHASCGPDKSLRFACGRPATTDFPTADTYACAAHAEAMRRWLAAHPEWGS